MRRMIDRLNAVMPTICFLLAAPVMSATAFAQQYPGVPITGNDALSDMKAGSVLIYNLYASSATDPQKEDTRITITNTSVDSTVFLRLFFVNGTSCEVFDNYGCLTKRQTVTAFASDLDPGVTGYLIVVAVDEQTGMPIDFNHLIGEAVVMLASGHAAKLNAVAIEAKFKFTPPPPRFIPSEVKLNFNGAMYERVPRVLALAGIPSVNDGNSTLLVINRLGGALGPGGAMGAIGSVLGFFHDDMENPFAFTFSGRCQVRGVLSDIFPRTAPRLSTIIPSGRSGWMPLWTSGGDDSFSRGGRGMLGAAITLNSSGGRAFNGGGNLHALSLTTDSLVMPVIPPSC